VSNINGRVSFQTNAAKSNDTIRSPR